MAFINRPARIAVDSIAFIMAANMFVLTVWAFLAHGNDEFSVVEKFLRGIEIDTLGLWTRVLALGISAALMIAIGIGAGAKIKAWLSFGVSLLFFYVTTLSVIFTDPWTYYWTQPMVYAFVSGCTYIAYRADHYVGR